MEERDLENISILVVEDDPGILMLLCTFFVAAGASVLTEKDGRNVLSRVEQNQPDLIILDVIMPYMGGFAVLERLREADLLIPVIMLTDQNTIDDKIKGLEFGADDYVTKPFSTRELLARVKSLLRRVSGGTAQETLETIVVGTMQIRVPSREIIMAGGAPLHFTKTEFDLICFLARKKDLVVSHTELLEQVMGYKGDIETKALVMHIANMRKKLQRSGEISFAIETVAGIGYKLAANKESI